MTDWNMWKERAIHFTRAGVTKAKDLGEIARLNLDNISEEEKIRKAYLEIGMRYVKLHEHDPEEGFEGMIQQINSAKANIVINKEKIARIKTDGNLSDEDLEQAEEDIALKAADATKE